MASHRSFRLSLRFKAVLIGLLSTLFVTGVIWAFLHCFVKVETDFGPAGHPLEPVMLKAHGAAAMLTLIALGALWPVHIRHGLQRKRNTVSGIALLASLIILVATGYGLYYFGDENLRNANSIGHTLTGLALPLFVVVHIMAGRFSRRGNTKPGKKFSGLGASECLQTESAAVAGPGEAMAAQPPRRL